MNFPPKEADHIWQQVGNFFRREDNQEALLSTYSPAPIPAI